VTAPSPDPTSIRKETPFPKLHPFGASGASITLYLPTPSPCSYFFRILILTLVTAEELRANIGLTQNSFQEHNLVSTYYELCI